MQTVGVGDAGIPKIIHHVWVGPRRFPEDAERNVALWKTILPEFEVVRWTEENIDFSPKFIRQAYAVGAYNRVANYARAAALHQHGGVYLDHDVELLKPFGALMDVPFFAGFQTLQPDRLDLVNSAVIGSVRGHPFIEKVLTTLDTMDGGHDWGSGSGPGLFSRLLREEGPLTPSTSVQLMGDKRLCPPSYFYPYEWDAEFHPDCVTEETIAVHRWAHTWKGAKKRSLLKSVARISPTLGSAAMRARNRLSRGAA